MKRIDTPETLKRFTGHVCLRDPLPYADLAAFSEAFERTKWKLCKEALELRRKAIVEKDEEKQKKLWDKFAIHLTECVDSENTPRCKAPMVPLAKHATILPALLRCVEEWHVQGIPANVTPATFPSTPQPEAGMLVEWLIDGMLSFISGDDQEGDQDPNA